MVLEFRYGGYSSPPDNAVIFIETGSRTGLFVVGKSSVTVISKFKLSTQSPAAVYRDSGLSRENPSLSDSVQPLSIRIPRNIKICLKKVLDF